MFTIYFYIYRDPLDWVSLWYGSGNQRAMC